MNRYCLLLFALCWAITGIHAEGSESLSNVEDDYYEYIDQIAFTGDNGMSWRAVGAIDCETGGWRTLTRSATVSGNGLYGTLNSVQVAAGVGEVSFYVKGMNTGKGYGTRTFRITAGDHSTDITVSIPSNKLSYLVTATVNQTNANTISIQSMPTSTDETAVFGIYNIKWTSYNGRTFPPEVAIDSLSVYEVSESDTLYYASDTLALSLSSKSEDAVFYYTIDGTEPTLESQSGKRIVLSAGPSYQIRAIAVSPSKGTSEETIVSIHTRKGYTYKNDCSSALHWEGANLYTQTNYKSESGKPYYSLMRGNDTILSPVVVRPVALSLYATSTNNHSLQVDYQEGTFIVNATDSTWVATSEWTTLQTYNASLFDAYSLTRLQVPLSEECLQANAVRFRMKSSGTSVFLDDIHYVANHIAQVGRPVSSVAEGIIEAGSNLLLSASEGSTIHYCLSGGEWESSLSPVNISITHSTILRAYATLDGMADSWVSEWTYIVPSGPTTINSTTPNHKSAKKEIRNGQLIINVDDVLYTLLGIRL